MGMMEMRNDMSIPFYDVYVKGIPEGHDEQVEIFAFTWVGPKSAIHRQARLTARQHGFKLDEISVKTRKKVVDTN